MKENNHTILDINKEIQDLYDRGYIETDSLGSKRYMFDAYDARYLTLLREVKRYRLELGFPNPQLYVISGHCRLLTLEREIESLQDQIRLKAINIISSKVGNKVYMEFKVGDRVEIVDKQNYWLNDREKKGVVVSSDQFNVEVSIDGYVYGSLGFEPSSLSLVTGMEYNFDSLTPLIKLCADESKQWWIDLETGEPKDRNIGEVLCLIHSEISEAMEGYRKDLNDDKLPHRKMIEVELADAVIRIFDLAGQKGYDLAGAMKEKMEYNRHRADHKIENRKKANGKKF